MTICQISDLLTYTNRYRTKYKNGIQIISQWLTVVLLFFCYSVILFFCSSVNNIMLFCYFIGIWLYLRFRIYKTGKRRLCSFQSNWIWFVSLFDFQFQNGIKVQRYEDKLVHRNGMKIIFGRQFLLTGGHQPKVHRYEDKLVHRNGMEIIFGRWFLLTGGQRQKLHSYEEKLVCKNWM